MTDNFKLLPTSLQDLTGELLISPSVRKDFASCSPADIAVGLACRLLHEQTVRYNGQDLTLYTPGSRFEVYAGTRITPPVPQRALEMALLLELATLKSDGPSEVLFSRRRHALVVHAGQCQGEVHLIRVEPPAVKTIARTLHDLLGGDHHDVRLGKRNDYAQGVAKHVTLHVPPQHVKNLNTLLSPHLRRGGLSVIPLILKDWTLE